jgi:hypothetical protein
MSLPIRLLFLVIFAGLSFQAASPAYAGPTESAFLESYIGNWKGDGLLTGGEEDEAFNCRVSVTKGREGKINYTGRCSVAGLNLTVAGTIAYIEESKRYEAAMTSNATFTGLAIGRKQGTRVVFDLRERDVHDGDDMTITSRVSLEKDTIGLSFKYVMEDDGFSMDAAVKFARMQN